ncbi:MAG: PAS domain S-box protein, partial [Planctomycetota bacterium]
SKWFSRLIPIRSSTGNVESVMVIAHEFSEQQRAETALRESEERYRALVEFCRDAIMIHRDEKFIYINTAAMALLGASSLQQVIGKKIFEILHSSYHQSVHERIKNIQKKKIRTNFLEEKFIRFDGQIIDVEVAAQEIIFDGKPAILAIGKDITKRKQAEAIQRANGELNRSIIEAMPGGIIQIRPDGSIEKANLQAQKILGLSFNQLTSRYVNDFAPETLWEDGSPCPVEEYPVSKCLKTGQPQPATTIGVRRLDGKISWAIYQAVPLKNPESGEIQGSIVMFVDITYRKQLEEEYRQAQKMEAIGHLAGGVAHDFNNLLSAILGYSEIALMDLPSTHPHYELFQKIYEAGKRAEGLTHQLLAFSRKQVLKVKFLDLNLEVLDFEKMISRLIGEDIRLETRLEHPLCFIKADPSQIQQVLMNLSVNARDAMPNGGNLILQTENVVFDEKTAPTELAPGPYILLSVIDNGQGIKPEILPHIFEPFFTTKSLGKGTGLGLSTVYGIIKQHNGAIYVESEFGKGTTFHIYFPGLALEKRPPSEPTLLVPEKEPGSNETILVVEDEEIVRKLICTMLTSQHYRVLEAENGVNALEMFRNTTLPLDLLFTDVVMPSMNGKELFKKLNLQYPQLKVVYASGYSSDVIDHQGILEKGVHFLQKPFTQADLVQKIQDALKSPSPPKKE